MAREWYTLLKTYKSPKHGFKWRVVDKLSQGAKQAVFSRPGPTDKFDINDRKDY